jgi:S-adenosylmethionine synthetase
MNSVENHLVKGGWNYRSGVPSGDVAKECVIAGVSIKKFPGSPVVAPVTLLISYI